MRAIVSFVISVLIFALLAGMYGVACWYELELLAIPVWVAMIVAIPLASLLHELGHMLFGAMSGIKSKPHFNILGSSSCSLIPKKDDKIKARVLLTAYGGVTVNLLVVIVCGALISLGVAPVWLSVLIPANAYICALNFIPAHYFSGKSDGLLIVEVMDERDEGKVLLAVLTVQAQILNGKPVEEVDESLLFDLPQIREDDQSFIALTELRYEYMKAKGNDTEAQKYKERFEQLKQDYM